MQRPWLVQRCELEDDDLVYDYMGASEFEIGGQSASLKRIFDEGISKDSVTIEVGGKEIVVYMVAAEGFPFADYQSCLQRIADNDLRLKEWTHFDEVARRLAGIDTGRRFEPRANVWFDFKNDVLWTLDENLLEALVSILEDIKAKWSKG